MAGSQEGRLRLFVASERRRVGDAHGIEHRLRSFQATDRWSPGHRWTRGQVERIHRTIKDATVKRRHCDSRDRPRAHLQLVADAYDHARRLKTLKGLTPYGFVCQARAKQPDRFRLDPLHHIPGPYSQAPLRPSLPLGTSPGRRRQRGRGAAGDAQAGGIRDRHRLIHFQPMIRK